MRDSEIFGHIRACAPGKVNLSLRVGPPRPDGYHEIVTLFCAVSVYEEVSVTPRIDGQITVSLAEHSRYGHGGEMPVDETNIAYRAAALLREHLGDAGFDGDSYGVDVLITKNVPIAGGMGGGSADAAATLVACAALWNAKLSKEDLADLGAQLGADVPFALLGDAAIGQGIGEVLSPLLCREQLHLVLVPSSKGLSTPQVYQKLDRMRAVEQVPEETPEIDPDLSGAVISGNAELVATFMINDLEPAAVALLPELSDTLDTGLAAGAMHGIVSGSGPTVFFVVASETASVSVAAALEHRLGCEAISVITPVHGARLL